DRQLTIRRVALDALHQDPANARAHGPENMAAIEASLARFGQAEPLVVHAGTGRVIGGNGRLAAMKRLGWTEADVVELDLEAVDATALGIALNRTGELAEWDDEALAKLLASLRDEGGLDGVGFDEAELDELLAQFEDEEAIEDVEPGELPATPVTRAGDLWVLGEHRLLCGDSTDAASYERVLGDERADLVWTDPPYGVSYVGGTDDALTIQNDELQGDDLEGFLRDALTPAAAACKPGACWYVAAPAGPNFLPFAQVLSDLGIWRQTLVWVKDSLVLGRSDYHYRHEALFYGWTPGAAHQPPPTRDRDTIWECPRPKASPDHPTTKPTALVVRAIENSSKRGAIVLDAFCGAGTTILAAEQTKRRARGIELDSKYCDVIVRRWQEATGKEATLDGVPFSTVKESRGVE
ncbi:MAG: DNA methyltransferase, partial [Planctomycetota bacterium]